MKKLTLFLAAQTFVLCAMCAMTLGATAAKAAEQAPLVTDGEYRVLLYPGVGNSQETAVIAKVIVPSTTMLPARVRIPIPTGARVGWVGELATQTGPDTELPYVTVNIDGNSFVEFTLDKSKTGQVDFNGLVLSNDAGTLSTRLDWVQTVQAQSTSFAVRLPANIHAVTISPKSSGGPEKNADGESLYSLGTKTLAVGDKQTITVSYKPGAGVGAFDINALVIAGVVVLLVIALVLFVFTLRRNVEVEE